MWLRRCRVVDGRRPAREDQALGQFGVDGFNWRVVRKNLAVNARFSDAPGDELCVLRSEVKYYYGFMILGHGLERVSDYSHGLDGFKDADFQKMMLTQILTVFLILGFASSDVLLSQPLTVRWRYESSVTNLT